MAIQKNFVERFSVYIWKGLTEDKGAFSSKKLAYDISVGVAAYAIIYLVHHDKLTWDLLVLFCIQCSGPGALREFLAAKTTWKAIEPPPADGDVTNVKVDVKS